MHACQSGGLAHYSNFREDIDFDHYSRLFGLRDFAQDASPEVNFPPFLVYGAGIDYKDEAWPDLAQELDHGLYEASVRRLCDHLDATGRQMLVILPPENLPRDLYRPEGLTLDRTERYNAIWRNLAETLPFLTVLDVDRVCHPEELVDVNHFRPAALQSVTNLIDVWYGCVSGAPEGEWMELAA